MAKPQGRGADSKLDGTHFERAPLKHDDIASAGLRVLPLIVTLIAMTLIATTSGCADGGDGLSLDLGANAAPPTPRGGVEPRSADPLLDPQFADSGTFEFAPGGGTEVGNSLVQDVFGRTVVVGSQQTIGTAVALRLDAIGVLDDPFGANGEVDLGLNPVDRSTADAVAISPSGAIAIAGGRFVADPLSSVTGTQSVRLWRLEPDGSLSPGFTTTGRGLLTFTTSEQIATVVAVAFDENERMLVVSNQPVGNDGATRWLLFCTLPNGQLDPTFGSSGRVAIEGIDGTSAFAGALASRGSGPVIVAGSTEVMRDGVLREVVTAWWIDETGVVIDTRMFPGTDPAVSEFATAIRATTTGRLVIAGNTQSSEPTPIYSAADGLPIHDGVVLVVDPTRELDETFGDGGRVALNLSNSNGDRIDRVRSLDVDLENRIVVVGETWPPTWEASTQSFLHGSPEQTLWRLLPDGNFDESFNANGAGTLGIGSLNGVVTDGTSVIVVGQSGDAPTLVVRRLLAP